MSAFVVYLIRIIFLSIPLVKRVHFFIQFLSSPDLTFLFIFSVHRKLPRNMQQGRDGSDVVVAEIQKRRRSKR